MSGSHRFPCPMAAASPTYGPGGRCTCEPIVSTCQHRTIGVASECLDCGETVMRRPHPPAASWSEDAERIPVYGCKAGTIVRTKRGSHIIEGDAVGILLSYIDTMNAVRAEMQAAIDYHAEQAKRPAPPSAPAVPEVVAAARRVVAEAKLTDAGWLIDSDAVQDLDDALNSKATKLSAPRRATPEMARAAANAHAASDKDKLDDWIRFVQAALDVANEGQRP